MNNLSTNLNSLTFHIRITKKCNADCSYCSSYENNADDRMSIVDLKRSLEFISILIEKYKLGGTREMLTVQYVGGELSTLPSYYLTSFVEEVEHTLSPLFKNFRHGGQSNLIASKAKVSHLVSLFDGNIGTSVDNFTEQRTVAKSSKKYKTIFLNNLSYTKKILGKTLSSILVIDEKMKPFIHEEIKIAENKRMNLTLRPVFQGGSPIEELKNNDLADLYEELFYNWFLKSNIVLEPHYSLLKKRILKYKEFNAKALDSISGCPFQNNCATSSINLEPNGDLYTCLDMADSKNYAFGNALNQTIDEDIFNILMQRTEKLNTDCITCDYYNECQGGCMNEAIEHTGDVFGKTQFCTIWKRVFSIIDKSIQKHSVLEIEQWLEKIEKN